MEMRSPGLDCNSSNQIVIRLALRFNGLPAYLEPLGCTVRLCRSAARFKRSASQHWMERSKFKSQGLRKFERENFRRAEKSLNEF